MFLGLTSPVTGSTVSGLTSPTYTVAEDRPPAANALQVAVTALGGTQTTVDVSTVSRPFTTAVYRPASLRILSPVDPVTGQLRNVPRNNFSVVTRKGLTPLAGQASVVGIVRTVSEVPAGADTADAPNIRAMHSCHIGVLNQVSSAYTGMTISGILANS